MVRGPVLQCGECGELRHIAARGLCERCYQRWRRHFGPTAEQLAIDALQSYWLGDILDLPPAGEVECE
jgi:hypothetical protein